MFLQRFDRVGAAGGGESTRRGAAIDGTLIALYQANQEGSRRSNCVRSNWSSTNDRDAAMGWAPIRNIPDGSVPADDAACSMTRNCRRTRLRTTAGPSARPRANATRGGVAMPGGSRMNVHHRTPARARCPSAAKRANARRSRMRQIKPTDACGPWPDVTSARLGQRGCSSGGGSRASWPGDGCWVGRCASRSPPRAARGSTYGSNSGRSEGALQHTSNARTATQATVARRPVATATITAARETACGTFRSEDGREFGSVRPSRPMVVHTMWTKVWISIDRQEGGAGERP